MTGLVVAGFETRMIILQTSMGAFEAIIEGVNIAFSWPTIGLMAAGVLIGIFIGAIPGIGPSIGMAVLLPLTLTVDPASGVILLVSIYSGGMYGGSISAIMLNVPGTAGSAATTFDGYPLSRSGRAMDALVISAFSSGVGGLITVLTLFAITPVLVEIVLLFTSPEYFLISILGLSMITVIAQGSMVKGLVAGFFGLMLTTIGIAETTADVRYSFDSLLLFDGLHFIAILIGLFAISEMIKLAGETGGIARSVETFEGSIMPGIKIVLSHPIGLFKSAFIGLFIGSIPGAGSSVANFVAYTEMVRSTDGGKFGNGDERGVLAPEAANNGNVAGSLIPTLSFGIPGSGATAVLLGGLILHGLIPGPNMFNEALDITYGIFTALLIGNIIILIVGLTIVRRMSYITKIDTNIIVPLITVLAVVGAFALRRNTIDIATVFVIGIIGYYMKKHDYSIIAFVLGAVLGPIAEQNLLRSLNLSDGDYMIFLSRPLSILLVLMIVLILFAPVLRQAIDRVRGAGTS